MEENKIQHNLKFDVWKEETSNWNERDALHLANVISICRLGQNMKFDKFGTISYTEDDKNTHWMPIVTEQEAFNKKASNCMIFNLDIPNSDYDKIFVYHYKAGVKGRSGYYIHSTTNPEIHIHKYYMANDMNILLSSLNRVVFELIRKANKTEGHSYA